MKEGVWYNTSLLSYFEKTNWNWHGQSIWGSNVSNGIIFSRFRPIWNHRIIEALSTAPLSSSSGDNFRALSSKLDRSQVLSSLSQKELREGSALVASGNVARCILVKANKRPFNDTTSDWNSSQNIDANPTLTNESKRCFFPLENGRSV